MQSTSPLGSSAWEAFRLTSKSPSELFATLGPQGIDNLVSQALAVCWRELPEDSRTLDAALRAAREAFDRNARHWSSIKKASPAAFFENLSTRAADGYFRQALVLCHMMMPRSKRSLADAMRVVRHIFHRNIDAWQEDNTVLTASPSRKPSRPPRTPPRAPTRPTPARNKSTKTPPRKPAARKSAKPSPPARSRKRP